MIFHVNLNTEKNSWMVLVTCDHKQGTKKKKKKRGGKKILKNSIIYQFTEMALYTEI